MVHNSKVWHNVVYAITYTILYSIIQLISTSNSAC